MREFAQLKEMTVDELEIAHRDISKELYDLRNEIMRSRKIEKSHLVRQKKKERARVLTLIRQKAGVNKL